MNERGTWKIEPNGGFSDFSEGDVYNSDALDALGEPTVDFRKWRGRGNAKDIVHVEFKTLADFCKEYVPLDYSIEGLLRTSSLYTLTARTGHGKTALLVAASFAVATGRPDILGMDAKRGRVAYLTLSFSIAASSQKTPSRN